MEYVMVEITCPECGGEGHLETMTALTYDGAQTWRTDECPECSGNKVVIAPELCPYCDEEMLATDIETRGGKTAHVECWEYIPLDKGGRIE